MLFLTKYAEGRGIYGDYIKADTLAQARDIAGRRGLNETIEGRIESPGMPHRLHKLIAEEKWLDAAHEAAFLGFVGITSGALSARDILGDHGLVHELLHLCTPLTHHPDEDPQIVAYDKREREQVIKHVKVLAHQFERRVPGWQTSGPDYLQGDDLDG